ncbi:MAG: Rid family detoxifying hydrolase [Peptococcaceae bacterium]|jgi:2-iminobutanoate/2-iminopropanoate deaminase|nr:Rid family detoxifying hydrolase [Peptococcaceae bacterium]
MKKAIVSSQLSAAVGPYSQAIDVNGQIYLSGIIAIDPETGVLSGSVEEQAERVLTGLEYVLAAAGSSMDQVVKTTVFLKSMEDFDKVNAIYAQHFRQPYPARVCVEVSGLPKNALVEIDAIAYR